VIPYNRNLKEASRNLRGNLTEAERCLWERIKLKHLSFCFYRQKPIGNYIVDFYCPKARLVMKIDGGRHFSGDEVDNDNFRDKYMRSLGLTTLRFSNSEVLTNTDKIAEMIFDYFSKILLSPPLKRGTTVSAKRTVGIEK
jgi:very-short-patch-repair endonuclease